MKTYTGYDTFPRGLENQEHQSVNVLDVHIVQQSMNKCIGMINTKFSRVVPSEKAGWKEIHSTWVSGVSMQWVKDGWHMDNC